MHILYVTGIMCIYGVGEEWGVTVAAWGESAFSSLQTWLKFTTAGRPGSTVQTTLWHSNNSHRRDYLTFLGAGGSNVTWFLSRGETTSWFIKRCPAQYLEFPQYIFCTPKWNHCRLHINLIKTYASRWLLLVTRSCQSALRCMSEVQVSWHKSALCV